MTTQAQISDSEVSPDSGRYRDATQCEIQELERWARQEHISHGIENPSDVMIQIRVRSLAEAKGLRIPGLTKPPDSRPRPARGTKQPNYLQASLEQQGQQCAKHRRAAKLAKHIKIVRENSDRFYLFCFLKGGFARAMRKCRALEVLAAVIEQLCGDIETWVSIETLAQRLGHTRKTVAKALEELAARRIISLADAASRYYSLDGKPIEKNQGYVIHLHAPMYWDWDSIGGVPDGMRKYLADYDDDSVEM